MRPIRRLPSQRHLYIPAHTKAVVEVATVARESAVTEVAEYPFELLAYADGIPYPAYATPVKVRKVRRATENLGAGAMSAAQ
jgi:hypothetical protein